MEQQQPAQRGRPETQEGPIHRERPAGLPGAVVWERDPVAYGTTGRVLPDGCMDVIWHDPVGLLVAGPDTCAQLAETPAGTSYTGLRLPPGLGPRVFGVAAHELRDLRVPLTQLWSPSKVRELTERVAAARFPGVVLERAAADRLSRSAVGGPVSGVRFGAGVPGDGAAAIRSTAGRGSGPEPGTPVAHRGGPPGSEPTVLTRSASPRRFTRAVGVSGGGACSDPARGTERLRRLVLAGAAGRVPVAALAREVGLSERQLHRRCRDLFGYGAMTLVRVLRMQQAVRLARGGLPFARVAAECGYSDQAHLSREIRQLAGVPLSQLR